jgi:hypothetical protein
MLATLGYLYGLALALQVVFVGLTMGLVAAVGGRATELAIGSPALVKLRLGDRRLTLGPIPTGAVTIVGRDGTPSDDPRAWPRIALGRRLIVVVGPWLCLLALAIGCLGASRALASFAHAWAQLWLVFDLTPLVRRFVALMLSAPGGVVLGVLCAKTVAINLTPLPPFAGGGAIRELTGRMGLRWAMVGMGAGLYLMARVAYAVGRVALS